MIKGLLFAFALVIALLAFGWFISNSISDALESQDNLDQNTIDTLNNLEGNYINVELIVLIITALSIAILAIMAVGKFGTDGNVYDGVDTDNVPFESCKELEDAITILKKRYVRGEINSYEYTEKMSRL